MDKKIVLLYIKMSNDCGGIANCFALGRKEELAMEEILVSIPEGRIFVDESSAVLEVLSRSKVQGFLNDRIGSPPISYKRLVHIMGLKTHDAISEKEQQVVAEVLANKEETAETFQPKLDAFIAKVKEMDVIIFEFARLNPKVIILLGE